MNNVAIFFRHQLKCASAQPLLADTFCVRADEFVLKSHVFLRAHFEMINFACKYLNLNCYGYSQVVSEKVKLTLEN